jgi:aspartate kinase
LGIIKLNISVHKFGGAVLSSEIGFLNMCNYLATNLNKNVVIISAIGYTSSLLKKSILIAEGGKVQHSIEILNSIFEQHYNLAQKVLNDNSYVKFQNNVQNIYTNCSNIIKSVSITKEVTSKTLDRFVAYGEDLALRLVECYFDADNNTIILDSRKIIRTNSNFNNAEPNYELIEPIINTDISKIITNYKNVIFQGFVGEDEFGNTTTMGFESSNLTATIIAKYLAVKELTIWTNVDGIYESDPNINDEARLINHLNYNNARNASLAGLKLIYPEMISIAEEKGITIIYRNGIKLSGKYTIINYENDDNPTMYVLKKLKLSNSKEINKDDLQFFSKELNNQYNFVKSNSEDKTNNYLQIIVLNPVKNLILSELINRYFNQISQGKMVIYTGNSTNYFTIMLNEEIINSDLVNSILNKLSKCLIN